MNGKLLSISLPLIFLISWNIAHSQTCLPDGIIFETQAAIDNFHLDYPGCTEIAGNVNINGSDIGNLNGLNVLTRIRGGLAIWTTSLDSLTGLDNIDSIGQNLNIHYNDRLKRLTGLEKLAFIGGSIHIHMNKALKDMQGLNGLISIGENLELVGNQSMYNLSGLNNLTSIGGILRIWMTYLRDFTGLENVVSIDGNILIYDNYHLKSLDGLNNIDPASIDDLYIYQNYSLSTCEVESICEYLLSPNGQVNIYSNGDGCNNPGEIAHACGFKMPCLPYGSYYFMEQSDVDSFLSYYDFCEDLNGSVIIGWHPIEGSLEMLETDFVNFKSAGKAVNNLQGLRQIRSIEGSLAIRGNHELTNLTGLENLSSIGGNLALRGWAYNQYLRTLDGLDNLESIGGGLFIGANAKLNSLKGLQNLKSIGGPLEIGFRFMGEIGNDSLTSLEGLENIDPGSIGNLEIKYNRSLSECEVQSICSYLAAPNGTVEILDNGPGCNSDTEIEEACEASSVNQKEIIPGFTIYPNPAVNELNIISNDGNNIHSVNIFNMPGGLVLKKENIINPIDISTLPDGMYFIEIFSPIHITRQKLIINR